MKLYDVIFEEFEYEETEWSYFDGAYSNICKRIDTNRYYIAAYREDDVFLASCFLNGNLSNIIIVNKDRLSNFHKTKYSLEPNDVLSIEIPYSMSGLLFNL